MRLALETGWDYIPEWKGNRKEKKEEQIVVHFEYLTGEDFYRSNGDKPAALAEFINKCTSIKNLKVTIDGGEEIEVTPEGVTNIPRLSDLFLELKLEFSRMNTDEKDFKKKS